MKTSDAGSTLQVPAREIPVPTSVSPQAQAVLAIGRLPSNTYPALDDLDGWHKTVAARDEAMAQIFADSASKIAADVEQVVMDGVPVFVVSPEGVADDDPRVYLEIHGGALILGGGESCHLMGLMSAEKTGARTWAVDYRMPPDHPYPAPLDDCVAVYRALLRDHAPDQIIIGGGSAGANLAAAVILRGRDEGLPLPAGALLMTPELDLTESGDSFQTNHGVDTVLTESLMPVNLLYAAGHDLAHPYLSPLFGDFTKGFSPTFLSAGTRDLFLSNAARMHRSLRSAGVACELHIIEAAPHGGFFGQAPEDADIDVEMHRFVTERWAQARTP